MIVEKISVPLNDNVTVAELTIRVPSYSYSSYYDAINKVSKTLSKFDIEANECRKILFKFSINLRKKFEKQFPHRRKKFKKFLMSIGHSARESQYICDVIGALGGRMRYCFNSYFAICSDLEYLRYIKKEHK